MKKIYAFIYHFKKTKSVLAKPNKTSILVVLSIISIFNFYFCTDKHNDVMVMGVDFEWQPIDFGSSDNPKILLTNVTEGTKRFYVGLVDLNVRTYDHGGGYVDSTGSGIISRGSIKGNYNGPAPWLPDMIHDYEITVEAHDENDRVIGMGKKVRKFHYGPK